MKPACVSAAGKDFPSRPSAAYVPGGSVGPGASRPGLRLVTAGFPGAALENDRAAVRLSQRDALGRRSLGILAAAFLRIRGDGRLGFIRLGDYSRERLGLSGRLLQELATVASRLEELPEVAAAFEHGEISWSHTRLIAGVAGRGSGAEWLERARGKTVQALAREIRAFRNAASSPEREEPGRPAESVLLQSLLDEEAGAIDGEEKVRFRVRCPARVRLLWCQAVELARRMLGTQAPVWQAAEAIAAEGISAAPKPLDTGAADANRAGPPEAAPQRPEPETLRAAFPHVDWGLPCRVAAAGEATVAAAPDTAAAGEEAEIAEAADHVSANRTGATGEDAAQAEDRFVEIARYAADLDAFELEVQMRALVRSLREIDGHMGRLLRRIADLRLHRALGFPSFDRYVRERLGMSPARARSLIQIERLSADSTRLATSWRSGELSWTRALEILRVVSGPHGSEWIARAGEVTFRQLSDEVGWALAMRDAAVAEGREPTLAPPPASARVALPDLQMCACRSAEAVDGEVTFCAPASVVGLFRVAVAAFTEPHEAASPGLPVQAHPTGRGRHGLRASPSIAGSSSRQRLAAYRASMLLCLFHPAGEMCAEAHSSPRADLPVAQECKAEKLRSRLRAG